MEALWALGLALKERREGQQLGEGTPKGEYNRLSLHKAILQEVLAEAAIAGLVTFSIGRPSAGTLRH